MNEPASAACILVVDDQTTNIQTVGTLLSTMGYDVMSATSAGQALQRLAARMPDLILLDMMMPGVSGLDLCRRLQGKARWAEIPVIFLSAAGEVPLITAALEAGAVDYVTKPFHRAELISRIRTHLALKAARDQLRRVAEDKDELLGLIAHDFKNHLAAMQVHAELLTKNPAELPPHAALSAAIISRESCRMARCVQELLANESAGREALKIETVAAAEIAAGAVAAIRPLAAAKEQTITLALPETPLAVSADAAALRQVLDNLLSNAVKFSRPGGSITVAVTGLAESVQFTVSDSGPGFSEDDIARAFHRYVRLSARPTAGETSTALGLSIAKKLTELMCGSIMIESTASGGRCTVHIPLAMETPPRM